MAAFEETKSLSPKLIAVHEEIAGLMSEAVNRHGMTAEQLLNLLANMTAGCIVGNFPESHHQGYAAHVAQWLPSLVAASRAQEDLARLLEGCAR